MSDVEALEQEVADLRRALELRKQLVQLREEMACTERELAGIEYRRQVFAWADRVTRR